MKRPLPRILAGLALVAGAASALADGTRIIAQLSPGVSASVVAASYQIRLVDTTPGAPFALFDARTEDLAEFVESRMESDPRVVWADDDDDLAMPSGHHAKGSTVTAVGTRETLYARNAGALRQIGFDRTSAFRTGRRVNVAVIDTGLSPRQTALWRKTFASLNLVERGQPAHDVPRRTDSNRNRIIDEATGHGTMVAGLIDQVAPRCFLAVIRVADSDGNATAWNVIRGIVQAVLWNCEVINVSLGSLTPLMAMGDILDWVEDRGATLVAAAGNNNRPALTYPARYSGVISVGALDPLNRRASFSNYDSGLVVSAPGTGLSTQFWSGTMAVWSGTSFSAPLVAGAIADGLRSTPARLEPSSVENAVKASGLSLDGTNPLFKGRLGVRLHVVRLRQWLMLGDGGP